jgi:hypothetical protein
MKTHFFPTLITLQTVPVTSFLRTVVKQIILRRIKSFIARNYFYCVRIYLNIDHVTRRFVSNVYFHNFAARSLQNSVQRDVYKVGITPVMNRFDPKLNAT